MSDAKEDALKKLAQIQEQAELTLAELPHRLAAEAEAEEAQIDDEQRAADHREREQVHRLDDREEPLRVADGAPDRRGLAPLEERQQIHRQPAAQLTIAGCGWMSQSNQL